MPVLLRWLLRLGPTNPIAVRLVQTASRRRKHLYVRAAYLAVLIIVLLWSLLLGTGGATPSYRDLAQAGANSFTAIAYLQIALICILAPVFMASAIAQEANPKTWDIVLTTPLGPGQIVLGNLFGRLFFILALLLASLPLFSLTQYYGGVPARSILASYLVAGSAALLVGAIAIALSVSRLVGRRAVFAFYVSVISYLALTAAANALITGAGGGAGPAGKGVTWMTGINPFLSLAALLNPRTYPRAEPGTYEGLAALFLESPVTAWVIGSTLLSVVLMGLSSFTVRAGGLQTIAGTRTRKRAPWYRKLLGFGAADSDTRPARSVWMNPIAWREAASRNSTFWKIVGRWAFVASGVLAGLIFVLIYHNGAINATTFRQLVLFAAWTETAVITLIAINTAATAISREREDGTLDLLLTTPITPGIYLFGKLRGLIAYLLPLLLVPTVTVGIAGVYALTDGLGSGKGTVITAGVSAPVILPEAGIVAGLSLLAFTAFCVMVGLSWSLKSKGVIGSMVATVGVIGVIGGIVGLCGWQSSNGIDVIGPALASLTPITALYAIAEPVDALNATVTNPSAGLGTARVSLAIGAAVTAGVYALVVYGFHASMVRGFDFTVRKLAGNK
ncbi:MAG: ABC transporter permease subunit [Planctomycetota bacterium]